MDNIWIDKDIYECMLVCKRVSARMIYANLFTCNISLNLLEGNGKGIYSMYIILSINYCVIKEI